MKQVYNWDTNILEINDKYNNHYYLELRGNKNIVNGESGTGKTFLYNRIQKLRYSRKYDSGYDVDNIITLNIDNIDKLSKYRDKLIIIDRADILLTDKEVDIINRDDYNRYLIFARSPLGIELSPNHFAEFEKENGTTKMKYAFSVQGWY